MNLDAATGISGTTCTDSAGTYNQTTYVATSTTYSGGPSSPQNFTTTTYNGTTVATFNQSSYQFMYNLNGFGGNLQNI